jgi:nucleoside-diphosphate-sugar epimerase
MNVLLTGATGSLGPHLVLELLRAKEIERLYLLCRSDEHASSARVQILRAGMIEAAGSADAAIARRDVMTVPGDVRDPWLGMVDGQYDALAPDLDVIIHAAADTRFTASSSELREVNVGGIRNVVGLAQRCPRLRQLLVVSTACVAGTRTGVIPERLDADPSSFVNEYERTKWHAERVAAGGHVPLRIARLSTCIGSAHNGYVHRFGAIHQSFRWFMRGLIPMVPGTSESRLDFMPSDIAARWIARAAMCPVDGLEVCHVAAGKLAVSLEDLIDCVVEHCRGTHPGWKARQLESPAIVTAETFDLFRRSVAQAGDLLLLRVLESACSFLPALLHPKVYRTEQAERVWGHALPLTDWRSTLGKVIDFGCARGWTSVAAPETSHA